MSRSLKAGFWRLAAMLGGFAPLGNEWAGKRTGCESRWARWSMAAAASTGDELKLWEVAAGPPRFAMAAIFAWSDGGMGVLTLVGLRRLVRRGAFESDMVGKVKTRNDGLHFLTTNVIMPVTVQWGSDRFTFELPAPDTQLAAIRHSIAAYTQLPYNAFAIVHDGAAMTDDSAPSESSPTTCGLR